MVKKKEDNTADSIKQTKIQLLDDLLDARVANKHEQLTESTNPLDELNSMLDQVHGRKNDKRVKKNTESVASAADTLTENLEESEAVRTGAVAETTGYDTALSEVADKIDAPNGAESLLEKERFRAEIEAKIAEAKALIPDFQAMSEADRFTASKKVLFIAPYKANAHLRRERADFRLMSGFADNNSVPVLHERDNSDRNSRQEERGGRQQDNRDDNQRSNKRKSSEPQEKQPVTEPQKVKGSTRLEAKRQRRRDVRGEGRHRRGHVTESEFQLRREAVERKMVVRTKADRVQIGVLEDKILVEHYVARDTDNSLIGNVYLGRVQNVLPSMEAAFVDIGRGRNAVLYSGEVDWSEYTGSNASRKIEEVLKPGDKVLVQVTKDPVGQKGARLTSQVSLPGRYLVYVPGGAVNGISRKLPDNERTRLKKILKKILPDGAGVIVRTAAEGATEEQLTRDVNHLTRQWEKIQRQAAVGAAPKTLHAEADMLIKIIRDVFNEDFHELIVDDHNTYKQIAEYLADLAPDLLERVKLHEGTNDVFAEYRVSEQIQKALDRKVWLPSGGSLVIDRTEAMTVIDVNTGKFVGSGGNLEQTVTKNNMEAAEEIVRQLRLRDIGGIIVVDFIDMVLESNRDLVQRRLIECLGRDRTKHQVAEVTSLGLVQMTRKKLGLGLLETFSEACDPCGGRGVVVNYEPQPGGRSYDRKSRARGNKQAVTHHITEGAKNMLAQVAAKTIPHAAELDSETHADGAAYETEVAVAGRKKPLKKRGVKRRAMKAAQTTEKAVAQEVSEIEAIVAEKATKKVKSAYKKQDQDNPDKGKKETSEQIITAALDALPRAEDDGSSKRRRVSRRASRP